MDTSEKLKRSWWVLFPFTILLPGFGFIYIGLNASNRNWIIEGITYQLPFFFYLASCVIYPANIMITYYLWLILLAALIAFIRSVMLALKLVEVYEKENRPVIVSSTYTSSGSSGGSAVSKKAKDFDWSSCCGCIILLFIVFAIISIL